MIDIFGIYIDQEKIQGTMYVGERQVKCMLKNKNITLPQVVGLPLVSLGKPATCPGDWPIHLRMLTSAMPTNPMAKNAAAMMLLPHWCWVCPPTHPSTPFPWIAADLVIISIIEQKYVRYITTYSLKFSLTRHKNHKPILMICNKPTSCTLHRVCPIYGCSKGACPCARHRYCTLQRDRLLACSWFCPGDSLGTLEQPHLQTCDGYAADEMSSI